MKLFIFFKPKKISDLKPIEFIVLKAIRLNGRDNDNCVTPSKICDELGLSKSALTAILNSLEDKQIIERNLSHNDRRMIILTLTEKGQELINDCHAEIRTPFINLSEYLGEEDTLKLIDLLNKSYEFLSK